MGAASLNDPDLSLAEMIDTWPRAAEVFFRHGMLCVFCEIAPFHTLSDACAEYGLDEAEMRSELRRAVLGDAAISPGPRGSAPAGAGR